MDAGNNLAGPMTYLQVLVLVEDPRVCQQELGVPLAHIASRSDFGAFRLAGGCCSLSAASEWRPLASRQTAQAFARASGWPARLARLGSGR